MQWIYVIVCLCAMYACMTHWIALQVMARGQWFCLQKINKIFWDTFTQKIIFLIIKFIIFRGDLTDISAKTATLPVGLRQLHSLVKESCLILTLSVYYCTMLQHFCCVALCCFLMRRKNNSQVIRSTGILHFAILIAQGDWSCILTGQLYPLVRPFRVPPKRTSDCH